jgi:hypothetical protein
MKHKAKHKRALAKHHRESKNFLTQLARKMKLNAEKLLRDVKKAV